MKLIIGLGNPGSEYRGTRHNVGFEVIDELAGRWFASTAQRQFQASVREVFRCGLKILLISPSTFMNRSGETVQQAVRFYRTALTDLVVLCDDMNLAVGSLRWRGGGSAGGQKGLDDIISRLGSQEFPRLRLGVGRPPGRMDATSWVLGRYSARDREVMDVAVRLAADSVETWLDEGLATAMNRFNRTGKTAGDE